MQPRRSASVSFSRLWAARCASTRTCWRHCGMRSCTWCATPSRTEWKPRPSVPRLGSPRPGRGGWGACGAGGGGGLCAATTGGGSTGRRAGGAALGKSPAGQVRLEVLRRGGRVAFVCSDDGRGIDVEAVRRAAVDRGIVPASEAKSLAADQIIALLGAGGLTTSNDVTELSGRGIGLDVVRATTSRLKGEMSIRSEPGRGATVEVRVPISIASLQGIVVEAAGELAAIPLDAVLQTLRVRDSEVVRSAESDSILHKGNVIPFLPLDRMLRRSSSAGRNRGVWSAVVVQAGNRRVAVGVDRLLGTSNIVMRALPGVVEADPVVLGASLDAEGNPQLVLDPGGLVAAAERGRGATSEEARPQRAPVLVIDDSRSEERRVGK